jgi:surface antigen
MRAWLQKHKKKEDAKSASRAVTPPAPATPIATDAPSSNDVVDKVVESIEGGVKAEDTTNKEGTADGEFAADAEARATSTLPQGDSVSMTIVVSYLGC